MAGFCSITDALAEAQFETLKRINNKFEALRRLGLLLEQLGDLSNLIPNLASLIPVVGISLETYTNLRAACPMLNLPAVSDSSLEHLRSEVTTAYSKLTGKILNHPWMRMGKLQDELSNFQQKINSAFAQGGQYIQCLQAACQTVQSATAFVERVGQADVSKEINKTFTNFVTNAGNVLSTAGQAKLQNARDVVTQMQALGANVNADYKSAKALTLDISAPSALSSTPQDISPNPVFTLPNVAPSTSVTTPLPVVTTVSLQPSAPEVVTIVAPGGTVLPRQTTSPPTDAQIFTELQRLRDAHL